MPTLDADDELDAMISDGLVTVSYSSTGERMVTLTEKGLKEAAELVKQMVRKDA